MCFLIYLYIIRLKFNFRFIVENSIKYKRKKMVNMQLFVRGNDIKTVSADNSQPISQFKVK